MRFGNDVDQFVRLVERAGQAVASLPADCTIGISVGNLDKLISGKLNPMTAVATRKLKVSGDMTVAFKLGKLLG